MIAEILKIEPLSTSQTSFYTIKFEEKRVSEFTDFVERMMQNSDNQVEMAQIMAIIEAIAERGAHRRYFTRAEKNAYALPPKGKEYYIDSGDYGIRLYCLILNPHIVFLLNGGRKQTLKVTDENSGVSRYFYMANSLYDILIRDKIEGVLEWDHATIELSTDPFYSVNIKG